MPRPGLTTEPGEGGDRRRPSPPGRSSPPWTPRSREPAPIPPTHQRSRSRQSWQRCPAPHSGPCPVQVQVRRREPRGSPTDLTQPQDGTRRRKVPTYQQPARSDNRAATAPSPPQPPQHRNAPPRLPPPVRPRLPAGEQPIGCGAQEIAQPIAAKDPPRRRGCADTRHKPTNPEGALRARPITRKPPVSRGF